MAVHLTGFTINIAKAKKSKPTIRRTRKSRLCKAVVIKEDDVFKARVNLLNDEHFPDMLIIPFTVESYNLMGKQYVFSHKKDNTGHYVCYIRDKQWCTLFPGVSEQYTPFKERIVIVGNVVRIDGQLYFEYKEFMAFSEDVVPTNEFHIDESKPLFE